MLRQACFEGTHGEDDVVRNSFAVHHARVQRGGVAEERTAYATPAVAGLAKGADELPTRLPDGPSPQINQRFNSMTDDKNHSLLLHAQITL